MAGLKSWRELLETPLKGDEKPAEDGKALRNCETPEMTAFTPGRVSQEDPMRNPCETPEKPPELTPQRLVRIGPTTWAEAEWARGLCVFCEQPVAEGDVIACIGHRAKLDALVMPWDSRE